MVKEELRPCLFHRQQIQRTSMYFEFEFEILLYLFTLYSFRDTNISGTPTFTSKVQTKSSIVIEKRNDVVAPNVTSSVKSTTTDVPGSSLTLKRKEQMTPKIHHSSPTKKPKLVSDRSSGQPFILPPLKASGSLSQQAGHYAVTVTNNQGFAHLQVFKGTDSEPTWDLYLGYNAVALAASPAVIALGLEDGSLHTFHPAKGCRPAPPLAPPAPLAKVHAVGNAVCCLIFRCYLTYYYIAVVLFEH